MLLQEAATPSKVAACHGQTMRQASLTQESFQLINDTAITVELSLNGHGENFSPERTLTEILE